MSYPTPKFCGSETDGKIHGYYDTNKSVKCPKCSEKRVEERINLEIDQLLAKNKELKVKKLQSELENSARRNAQLKFEKKELREELDKAKEALEKIKDKAWGYTSPPMSEKIRVFADIIHNIAKQALKGKR